MTEVNPHDNPRMVRHPALQPEPPPAVEEPEPAPTAEPEPEPEPRVFVGGRERTVAEVVQGYEASTHEALRLKAERDALAAERDALRREADSYRERISAPSEPEIPELGEDADPRQLAAWVATVAERRAERIAAERVKASEAKFEQFIKTAQQFNAAQETMKGADPTFDANKLSSYLAANPDVQQRYNAIFAADQSAALEYGWTKAKAALGVPSAPESSRAVQPAAKRKAAPATTADVEKTRAAMIEEAEKTGNWERYYAWRAKGTSIQVPTE